MRNLNIFFSEIFSDIIQCMHNAALNTRDQAGAFTNVGVTSHRDCRPGCPAVREPRGPPARPPGGVPTGLLIVGGEAGTPLLQDSSRSLGQLLSCPSYLRSCLLTTPAAKSNLELLFQVRRRNTAEAFLFPGPWFVLISLPLFVVDCNAPGVVWGRRHPLCGAILLPPDCLEEAQGHILKAVRTPIDDLASPPPWKLSFPLHSPTFPHRDLPPPSLLAGLSGLGTASPRRAGGGWGWIIARLVRCHNLTNRVGGGGQVLSFAQKGLLAELIPKPQ